MKQPYHITTDVLEQQYGSVQAKILYQTQQQRLACIYAQSDNRPLEYALVHFKLKAAKQYADIHQTIVDGGLMGKTFRAAGIAFEREELASFLYDIPPHARALFGPLAAKACVKYAILRLGNDRIEYARNIELYAPDIDWPGESFGPGEYAQEIDQLQAELYKIWELNR